MGLDERNEELDKQLQVHPVEESVAVLMKDAKARKLQVRILLVSVILDILLTVGLTVVSIKTSDVAHLAQSNREAVFANCQTSNDSRHNNRILWDYLLALPPEQPQSDQQKLQIAKFKEFVATTFAERDCQAEINK